MSESKFPASAGESAAPPLKMRSPQKSEFTVTTQTPEHLVIQFHNTRTKHLMKIILIVFLLIPIPFIWVGVLSATAGPPQLPHPTFEESLAQSASIALPLFWGLDLLFLLIAMYMPLTDSFRIDTPQGIVTLHTIYAFRKKEKNAVLEIKEIAGLRELRFHFKKNQFFILALEMHAGSRITVYKSGYLQVIHELHDLVQKYLPALGIQENPGVKTSPG